MVAGIALTVFGLTILRRRSAAKALSMNDRC
jgi:hypothetical protein